MCASYLQHLSGAQLQALQEAFTGKKDPVENPPQEIRKPTLPSLILKKEGFQSAYFGVPFDKKLQINGRIESIVDRPYYQRVNWLRGVLPVSSFFEYDSGKFPVEMRLKDSPTFLATLHLDDRFLIITREATLQTRNIHPRLPYLLKEEQVHPYLFGELSFEELLVSVQPDEPLLELSGQMRLF